MESAEATAAAAVAAAAAVPAPASLPPSLHPLYLQVDGEAYKLEYPAWLRIERAGKIHLVSFA